MVENSDKKNKGLIDNKVEKYQKIKRGVNQKEYQHYVKGHNSKQAVKASKKYKKITKNQVKTAKRDYVLTKKDFNNINKSNNIKVKNTSIGSKMNNESTLSKSKNIKYVLSKNSIIKASETQKNLNQAKKKLDKAKLDRAISKKVYKRAVAKNGGSTKQKIGRMLKQNAHRAGTQNVDGTLNNDDVLSDVSNARQKSRQINSSITTSKKTLGYSKKFTKWTVSKTYGGINRSYNFTRGKGFYRTPEEFSWQGKLKKRKHRIKSKFNKSKIGQVFKASNKVVKVVSKPFLTVLRNPLSIVGLLTAFFLLIAVGFFISASSPIQQDEFDLNDTWLYASQLDRENSDDKVDYWTNIDDILLYMNYRFEDFTLNDTLDDTYSNQANIGKSYLTGLWNKLNSDTSNLKKMSDLYTTVYPYKLSKSDLEEYQSMLEESEEYGKYSSLVELDNPFYTVDEVNYNVPLKIVDRFGYKNKTDISNTSTLQANGGQTLYATMTGEIKIKDSDVIISTSDTKFIYKNVEGIRYKTGDTVNSGDIIGKVKSSGNQVVSYQKYHSDPTDILGDKMIWTYLNVGFYFEKVEYTQTTSVMSDMDIDGAMAKRAKAIYDYFKKAIPETTFNGVSAILGNFATESSINPKRAEGDYLSPPVGASASSWDDESWLAMGGNEIYGGRYPNILHRGLGLGQWTDTSDGGRRHTALLEFAKSKNKKWYDLEIQLDFILNGDSPYYQTLVRQIVTSDGNVSDLTKQFLNKWEGNQGDKLKERQSSAQQWYTWLKNESSSATASATVPAEYKDKLPYGLPSDKATNQGQGYAGNAYAEGQCTYYVYNRFAQIGKNIYPYLGNANQWVDSGKAQGYSVSNTPKVGTAVVFMGGVAGASAQYGHVAFCEYVNSDGSFLISEMNYGGLYKMNWRVLSPQNGIYFVSP